MSIQHTVIGAALTLATATAPVACQRNLIATSASVNRSKGSDLPPGWAPPDPAAGCPFARVVLGTAGNWDLVLTAEQTSELHALCGGAP